MENYAGKYENRIGGMITIEVSVIIPILSLIITGLVFMLLFFLDISVAKSEAIRMADEVAAVWKTDGELVDGSFDPDTLLSRDIYFLMKNKRADLTAEAEKRMRTRIKERLSITSLDKINVSIQSQKVKTEVELSFKWPLQGISSIMGEPMSFSCEAESLVDNWQEALRQEGGLSWK